MKKLLMLFLLTLCAMLFCAQAETGGNYRNIQWTLSDGGALTIRGSGAMPDFYYNYFTLMTSAPWGAYSDEIDSVVISGGITSVGDYAFAGCAAGEVSLPEGLVSIGEGAFMYCENLQEIAIPQTVASIGAEAFGLSGLKIVRTENGLSDSIDICSAFAETEWYDSYFENNAVHTPDGLVLLGSTVVNYEGSGGEVTIPSDIVRIANGAFSGSGITTLTVENGVLTIGSYAFEHCGRLERVSLPASIESIGDGAFAYCEILSTVTGYSFSRWETDRVLGYTPFWFETMSSSAPELRSGMDVYPGLYCYTAAESGMQRISIEGGEYSACIYRAGRVIDADAYNNGGEIRFTASAGERVLIAVSTYDDDAYLYVEEVSVSEEFVVEDGVLTVYNGPGGDVVIPANVTAIGYEAFNWKRLSSVTLPDGLVSIGESAFTSCGLTEIIMPAGLKNIGMSAFEGNEFTEIVIPDSVVFIDSLAFAYCPNLKRAVLGSGITAVTDDLFDGCENLEEVDFRCDNVSIPDNFLTGLFPVICCRPDSNAEEWALTQGRRIRYTGIDTAHEIVLPMGVKHIGSEAYANTAALKITVNSDCETIGSRAFAGCVNLRVVIIPDSVTFIAEDAFEGCGKLSVITVD